MPMIRPHEDKITTAIRYAAPHSEDRGSDYDFRNPDLIYVSYAKIAHLLDTSQTVLNQLEVRVEFPIDTDAILMTVNDFRTVYLIPPSHITVDEVKRVLSIDLTGLEYETENGDTIATPPFDRLEHSVEVRRKVASNELTETYDDSNVSSEDMQKQVAHLLSVLQDTQALLNDKYLTKDDSFSSEGPFTGGQELVMRGYKIKALAYPNGLTDGANAFSTCDIVKEHGTHSRESTPPIAAGDDLTAFFEGYPELFSPSPLWFDPTTGKLSPFITSDTYQGFVSILERHKPAYGYVTGKLDASGYVISSTSSSQFKQTGGTNYPKVGVWTVTVLRPGAEAVVYNGVTPTSGFPSTSNANAGFIAVCTNYDASMETPPKQVWAEAVTFSAQDPDNQIDAIRLMKRADVGGRQIVMLYVVGSFLTNAGTASEDFNLTNIYAWLDTQGVTVGGTPTYVVIDYEGYHSTKLNIAYSGAEQDTARTKMLNLMSALKSHYGTGIKVGYWGLPYMIYSSWYGQNSATKTAHEDAQYAIQKPVMQASDFLMPKAYLYWTDERSTSPTAREFQLFATNTANTPAQHQDAYNEYVRYVKAGCSLALRALTEYSLTIPVVPTMWVQYDYIGPVLGPFNGTTEQNQIVATKTFVEYMREILSYDSRITGYNLWFALDFHLSSLWSHTTTAPSYGFHRSIIQALYGGVNPVPSLYPYWDDSNLKKDIARRMNAYVLQLMRSLGKEFT